MVCVVKRLRAAKIAQNMMYGGLRPREWAGVSR